METPTRRSGLADLTNVVQQEGVRKFLVQPPRSGRKKSPQRTSLREDELCTEVDELQQPLHFQYRQDQYFGSKSPRTQFEYHSGIVTPMKPIPEVDEDSENSKPQDEMEDPDAIFNPTPKKFTTAKIVVTDAWATPKTDKEQQKANTPKTPEEEMLDKLRGMESEMSKVFDSGRKQLAKLQKEVKHQHQRLVDQVNQSKEASRIAQDLSQRAIQLDSMESMLMSSMMNNTFHTSLSRSNRASINRKPSLRKSATLRGINSNNNNNNISSNSNNNTSGTSNSSETPSTPVSRARPQSISRRKPHLLNREDFFSPLSNRGRKFLEMTKMFDTAVNESDGISTDAINQAMAKLKRLSQNSDPKTATIKNTTSNVPTDDTTETTAATYKDGKPSLVSKPVIRMKIYLGKIGKAKVQLGMVGKDEGIFVRETKPSPECTNVSLLQKWDRIVSVNGSSLEAKSNVEARDIFKEHLLSHRPITVEVLRGDGSHPRSRSDSKTSSVTKRPPQLRQCSAEEVQELLLNVTASAEDFV